MAIRINPDVEPKTHKYITTGKLTNKFGIDFKSAAQILLVRKALTNIKISGLHIHIGSQITDSEPYVAAITKTISFINKLKKEGVRLDYLNIGGGLGITYNNETPQTANAFAGKIMPLLKRSGLKIIMEPGRFISGNSGILVTKILYIKSAPKKKFVIVDAGMNDLIRPALYDAYHAIQTVRRTAAPKLKYEMVGPICETGDFLGHAREIAVDQGSLLAVMSAGAYGMSMSSNYNTRPRAAEVMVDGKDVYLIRERETVQQLFAGEKVIP